MAKLSVFFLAVLLSLTASAVSTRSKRFATLASTAIGGAAGCVVTGNDLYANGFKIRQLTSAEMSELSQYQTSVADYKKKVKAALEQRREKLKERMAGQFQSTASENNSSDDLNVMPPARPSFCSENLTTQYYFDGCMVQDNKVIDILMLYVGKTFARDLTTEEQQQLKDFDVKMTGYQKQLQENIQKQVKGMFGGSDFFSALFGGVQESIQEDSQSSQMRGVETTTAVAPSSSTAVPLQIPDAPQFCFAI